MAQLKVKVDAFVLKPALSETHGDYVLTRRQVPDEHGEHLWEIKRGDEVVWVSNEPGARGGLTSLLEQETK